MMETNHIESYLCQLGHQDHHQDNEDDDDQYNGRAINKVSKNDIEGEREQALVDQWVSFLSSSSQAEVDRGEGTVLMGKLLTPRFAPSALSSEQNLPPF